MSDILTLADSLEPNVPLFKGDLQKIANIHVSFYRFYIKLASKCDALVFDKKGLDYLKSCISYLERKKLTKKGIQQSRNNCLKMLDSLNDLCVTLNCDKKMLAGLNKLVDQAVVDDEEKGEGTLDLLKQLKNLLNAPGDTNDNDNNDGNVDGRVSPVSTSSSAPEQESVGNRGGAEPMIQYLLNDSGIDGHYHEGVRDAKRSALTSQMNKIMVSAAHLRENTYVSLDTLMAKLEWNVPIWDYHVDRVDSIDSSSVIDNIEIFGGNKSVTDAVLYSCPNYLTVGPFDVYARNKVFVYHCLVKNCNNCMTTSLEILKLHGKYHHGDTKLDWYCTDCDLINLHSSCQKSLDGALDHLAKHHSVKPTYCLAKERLLENNKKIMKDDPNSSNMCPQPKSEEFSEDNTDLFHCPNPECSFSTNAMSDAFGHCSTSEENLTVQCRYCPLILYSSYELCVHLFKNHGNSVYKCGYCPYRSVSKVNCLYHQNDSHSGSPSRILSFDPLPFAEHKYSCRAHNSIKPFVCDDSCNFGTMVLQKFIQHFLTHPGKSVTCHYCEKYTSDDIGDLESHFLVHGVGEYLCLYCKEAFDSLGKVQRHLHQHHPSQYPFMIICQDYNEKSPTLTLSYSKEQKLELGEEEIVVVAMESDKNVHTATLISKSESILIEDVDHCKMQLKLFMKNKEEQEEIPYIPALPYVEETLDLTLSEDPKESVDIKPRLRVRTLEEIISAPVVRSNLVEPEKPDDTEVATFYAFSEPMDISSSKEPRFVTPMLTPAQIKQEQCGMVQDEPPEAEIEPHIDDVVISSVQIKREIMETNPVRKSPAKSKPKSAKSIPENSVNVKMEAIESREMQVDCPSPQSLSIDESREAQDAVAALITQEGRRSSVSDGESGRTPKNTPVKQPRMSNVESLNPSFESATPDCVTSPTSEPGALARYLASADMFLPETTGSLETEISPELNESSIDNAADCHSEAEDVKEFTVSSDGKLSFTPQYAGPTVVDTVIISSEGEDDFEDVISPQSSNPSPNLAGQISPTSSINPSSGLSKATSIQMVPKLTRIFPLPSLPNIQPNKAPATHLLVYPRAISARVRSDVKRYRCKLCSFSSEDRQITYNHLTLVHPNRFTKQFHKVSAPPVATEEKLVRTISCPYCRDLAYEGLKSFERHHRQVHGDYTEVKCFLEYTSRTSPHLSQIFACTLCGHFSRNEEAVWQHLRASHPAKVAAMKKPLHLKCTVALKKNICPLYNCLDEFLDPVAFLSHIDSHSEVIACKKCTYIADSLEEFQKFHLKIPSEDRLLHFYYTQSSEERANLQFVQRFNDPLYTMSAVYFNEKTSDPSNSTPVVRKTTARKSTGGAQYQARNK